MSFRSFCATHARLAIVFAQLSVDSVERGVHAFLVEIRNAKGEVAKGVRIEDVGVKPVLNGNDK